MEENLSGRSVGIKRPLWIGSVSKGNNELAMTGNTKMIEFIGECVTIGGVSIFLVILLRHSKSRFFLSMIGSTLGLLPIKSGTLILYCLYFTLFRIVFTPNQSIMPKKQNARKRNGPKTSKQLKK